jgi:hypothetical protein
MRICNAQHRLNGYKEDIPRFFFALQMLILTTAELQIRQDGVITVFCYFVFFVFCDIVIVFICLSRFTEYT